MVTRSRVKSALPWLLLLVGMLGFFVLVRFKSAPVPRPNSEVAWPVRSMSVTKGVHTPSVLLYAKVDSSQHATLSAGVSAVVKHVAVRDGDRVQSQQLLVEMDNREELVALSSARAQVAEATARLAQERIALASEHATVAHEKSRLALQTREFERKRALMKQSYISQSNYDDEKEALSNHQLAYQNRVRSVKEMEEKLKLYQAQLTRAQAQLRQAEIDESACRVLAPFAGVVTDVHVAKGERMAKGAALMQVMSNNDIEARALIPSNVLSEVVNGYQHKPDGLMASGKLNDHPMQLSLARIAARVKQGQVGREAIFKITEGRNMAVTGEVFPLRLQLPKIAQVFSIPATSLYDDGAVYRITAEQRLERVPVDVVGQSNNADSSLQVLVKSSDLKSGDRIIENQMPNAINGLLVKKSSEA